MKRTARPILLVLLVLCCVALTGCLYAALRTDSQASATSEQQDILDILITVKTAVRFTSEQVSEEHIEKILLAGLNAPSAWNSQPWHLSVVTNREILNEISEAMSTGTPGGGSGRPSATGGAFRRLGLADAPVAIFIYGTNNLPTDSYDCGLATEAMSVAALSLGYGTKILSLPSIVLNGPKKAYFDELLQVPKGYNNIAILLIGRNDESIDATTNASKRYTIDQKVRFID